ncbi:GLPGLI family protein [Rhizosphaericola mali]|uniref:GLPGLI family protein n=1 Tax=Rhizosphaericola mali TaxID=2545455 RepID=A0A5P2G2C9_9BACT|nr:GLPGLI family protein [Rhizosphaericola mali]QES88249.1 GLPGLI family protein [Rhizosphaericola mali]
MKKYIIITLVLIGFASQGFSQNARFITSGKIVFERRTQIQKTVQEFVELTPMMKNQSEQIMQMFNGKYKPFQVTDYVMNFNSTASYYTPSDPQPDTHQEFDRMFNMPGQDNSVFTNYSDQKRLSTKGIFNTTLNISDSIEPIRWRIMDETRDIAGFECRRANGLIHDSVYVVAFYTPQIVPSMGPESFHGLPGMILGLSLPYLHSTWFATTVTPSTTPLVVDDSKINKKIKTVNEKEFQATIKQIASAFGGGDGGKYLIQFLNF